MCRFSLTWWYSCSRPLCSCPAEQCPTAHAVPSHHSYSLFFLPGMPWPSLLFLFIVVYVISLVTEHLLRSILGNIVNIKLRITIWSVPILSSVQPALSALQTGSHCWDPLKAVRGFAWAFTTRASECLFKCKTTPHYTYAATVRSDCSYSSLVVKLHKTSKKKKGRMELTKSAKQ